MQWLWIEEEEKGDKASFEESFEEEEEIEL